MYDLLGKIVMGTYLYYNEKEEQDKVKFELIKNNFNYHYENNNYYHSLCNESNISPQDIQDVNDLIKIPLIPMSTFKQPEEKSKYLLSVSLDKIEKEMRSSGTSGTASVARRDFDTYTVQQLATMMTYREFIIKNTGLEVKRAGLYLVPSPTDVNDMGMIKGFTLFDFALSTHEFAVENMNLNNEKALSCLKKWEGKFERFILAPPFMLNTFLDYLVENNIKLKLDKNSKIITVGGWKHHTGSQIAREELDNKCMEYLGIEKSQIRDFYGLAECNMILLECENNLKHIPPTYHITIRDINAPSKEVEDGKEGIIAILDPASSSYPAFILTEDMGIIRKNVKCSCGRTSDIISISGRTPKSNLKNCALTLEKYMDEQDKRKDLWSDESK